MALKSLLYATAGASLAIASPVTPIEGRADPATNYQRAADSAVILQQWYDQTTGLWTESNWWNSANILQALGNLDWSGDQHPFDIRAVYENTFSQAQKSFALSVQKTRLENSFLVVESHNFTVQPAVEGMARIEERGFDRFLNDYYDDEGWWALACKFSLVLVMEMKKIGVFCPRLSLSLSSPNPLRLYWTTF